MFRHLSFAVALSAGAACQAADADTSLRAFLDREVRAWAADPAVIASIRAQNAAHAAITRPEIDAMDAAWRAEVGTPGSALVNAVLANPAADVLRTRVAAQEGRVTEAFAMDRFGLNVAASHSTSDYWQGDEDKFTATFGAGAGAAHVGEVEFDESTQSYQAQLSVTVTDPDTGAPIGALTVAVDAEAVE
jgi:hypothetical protein